MRFDVPVNDLARHWIHCDGPRAKDHAIRNNCLIVDAFEAGRGLVRPDYLLFNKRWLAERSKPHAFAFEVVRPFLESSRPFYDISKSLNRCYRCRVEL